jgi:hypothetical protein
MSVVKISPPHPHLSWRTEVVCDPDPKEFGRQLQQALQSLTDEGFNIVNQMFRGESVIITAQRLDGVSAQFAPTLPAPPMNRRKIVQRAVGAVESGERTEEVIYSYLSTLFQEEPVMRRMYKSLREAVEAAIRDLDVEGHTPHSITVASTVTYPPKSWPGLLKQLVPVEDTAKEN